VYIAAAKIGVSVGESHSLKDKRMVVRKIKDRVKERVGVVVNEVGAQDVWQLAELGCAVVSAERAKAMAVLDDVVREVGSVAEISGVARQVVTFTGELEHIAKPEPDGWIPDAWREEAKK
jgi:hypothetical protein